MSDSNEVANNSTFDMPSSQPILIRALIVEASATAVLMLVFGVIGNLVDGTQGIVGGVLGALIAGLLSAVTIGSIAFANHRFITNPNYIVIFFAVVAGGWLLKLVAFVVVVALLKDQVWLNTQVLFFSFVAGIIVSLIVDVIIATRSRIPIAPAK